jgi:hypothetical protein
VIAILLALVAAAPAAKCASVELVIAEKRIPATYRGKPLRETTANFAKAQAKACAEGLLKAKTIAASNRLFLVNAPDANVASITSDKGRTVLEFGFVDHAGKVHVPTSAELHEAIYCAVHGASDAEQQESGHCLPD